MTYMDSLSMYGIPKECYDLTTKQVVMNAECVIKSICPQMTAHYVQAGIIMVCAFILVNLATYWFTRVGYRMDGMLIMGYSAIEDRAELEFAMLNGTSFGLLAYAAMVILFNSKGYFIIWLLIGMILLKYGVMFFVDKAQKKHALNLKAAQNSQESDNPADKPGQLK